MIIKIILVAAILIIAISLTLARQSSKVKAWKKIILCLFILSAIIAVIFPELISGLATFVGVGRGTDLLLYMLTLAFLSYAINGYVRQQKDKDVMFRLARKIALLEAKIENNDKKR